MAGCGEQLLDGDPVRPEHDDRGAGRRGEAAGPFGEFGVAHDHMRRDVGDERGDLAVGIVRIERRHLRPRRHAGLKADRHLQAVAHQISEPRAGGAALGKDRRQGRDGLRVLPIGQFALEAGEARRVGPPLGGEGERVDDGREMRIARIELRRRHARH